MNTPILILVLTILAAIAAFVANKQDIRQKNRIEELGTIGTNLTSEVKKLSEINNSIASKTDNIVAENKLLTEQNIELTNKAKILIEKVGALTEKSHVLLNKLDVKTDDEFAISGEFNLLLDKEQSDITLHYGSNEIINPKESFIFGLNINGMSVSANYAPIYFLIANDVLYITTKLYDEEANLIVEIENNKWRLNKNFVSKFNFDDKGVEIFDNKGRVFFSVNILPQNTIEIQAILASGKTLDLVTPNGFFGGINGDGISILNTLNIQPLFEYTGNKWRGVRRKKIIN